ncbi:glycosyltransferase [Cellulophaga baltica]|uniref:glycosyltransferase n=1 Tax=Cellulophaga baltica TaxID=76594 RepID=UPI0003F7AA58|nr:glycosyltransferase [Cellulophaga baltica]AIY13937.1 hypothetical protein M667_12365 [Cellulophaga baltica NN016038]
MSNKITIAFLLTVVSKRGGISRVTSILTDELERTGLYDIHIISYSTIDENGYNWNENLNYHTLLGEKMSMKKGLLKSIPKLRTILSKNNITTLIAAGSIVGPLGVFSTLFNKTKLIYWSHSSFRGSANNKYRLINEQFTAIFSKHLISLTKEDKKNYKNSTLAKNVCQIYNAIDSELLKQNISYNSESNKIISVGRLTYQKNFEGLIDVANELSKQNNDFVWDIYGSGENEKMLLAKIKENNLENKIFLKGQSNNLYNLYNDYCMMVMTSRYEGFPMSLIEGLACKLPLVSYDIPTGPNEIIRDDINGFLIEPFNKENMADKINVLLRDSAKRSFFSENNENYIDEYKMEYILKKWNDLLIELDR